MWILDLCHDNLSMHARKNNIYVDFRSLSWHLKPQIVHYLAALARLAARDRCPGRDAIQRQTLCMAIYIISHSCAQNYVGKFQSCMVISGRLIAHAPVQHQAEAAGGSEPTTRQATWHSPSEASCMACTEAAGHRVLSDCGDPAIAREGGISVVPRRGRLVPSSD